MLKRIVFILGMSILLCLGFRLSLEAQRQSQEEQGVVDYLRELAEIKTKTEEISANLNKANAEVLKKVDAVLANQQKILAELEVVKVRATRR